MSAFPICRLRIGCNDGREMKKNSKEFDLKLHPRPKEAIALDIPKDTLELLKKIADTREMSVEALIKFYIGQGLRQEISNERVKGKEL